MGFDIFSQVWLVVFPANQLSCLVYSKLSYKWIIVVTTSHLRVDDLSDIWETSVLKYSLDILSVL